MCFQGSARQGRRGDALPGNTSLFPLRFEKQWMPQPRRDDASSPGESSDSLPVRLARSRTLPAGHVWTGWRFARRRRRRLARRRRVRQIGAVCGSAGTRREVRAVAGCHAAPAARLAHARRSPHAAAARSHPGRIRRAAGRRHARLYTPHNSGADLYPYLILTAQLTDPDLYRGRMLEMLRNEVRYTTVAGLDSRRISNFDTGELGPPSLFGAGEYAKDGLLAVTEYLGRTPWFAPHGRHDGGRDGQRAGRLAIRQAAGRRTRS